MFFAERLVNEIYGIFTYKKNENNRNIKLVDKWQIVLIMIIYS